MQAPFQERGTRSTVLTKVVNLFGTVGTASAMIAPVLGLMWVRPSTEAPASEGPPGSGIVLRTEVTAIWMPRALRDRARHQAGPPVDRSLEEQWYALTYRLYQVNGELGEITQIRRLSEAADRLDELRAVMATAAGRPPRYEGQDFSHARVEVIPDMLQAVDPYDCRDNHPASRPHDVARDQLHVRLACPRATD
jgi:hypothetical protein